MNGRPDEARKARLTQAQPRRPQWLLALLAAGALLVSTALLLAACAGGGPTPPAAASAGPRLASTQAAGVQPSDFTGGSVRRADLPPEARQTLALIDRGGPFPHDQDGAVFQNREGRLPARPPGTYREYTVETPGADDRGARRLVTGEAGAVYYTDDHYASFRHVLP